MSAKVQRARAAGGLLGAAGSTIQIKLSAVIVALVVAVVTLLAGLFTARYVRDLEQSLQRKAETYGQLVAREVASAVAFEDRQTAREVFEAVGVDEEVSGLALYGASGRLLEARGELGPGQPAAPAGLTVSHTAAGIRVVAPVVSLEGPRGVLVLEMSNRAVVAGKRRALTLALGWGLAATVLGLLAAWFIARSLARRLGALSTAATAVAGGDLDQQPVVDASRDEIGRLTAAFNAMWAKLKALLDQIQRSAREEAARLEGLVKARTAELDERNGEMRLVLDHVEQGLLTVDADGRVGAERSRIVDTWFGAPAAGATLWDWLPAADDERRRWFAMAWQTLGEGVLPLEVAIDQLPARLDAGDRCFELSYKPLRDEPFTGMLVMISDATARRERERAELERKELGEVIERFYRDRAGVLQFFEEARRLVAMVADTRDLVVLGRALHTLKGNAGFVGLTSVVQLCHELETTLTDSGGFDAEARARLTRQWTDVEGRFSMILEQDRAGRFEMSERDYLAVLAAVDRGSPPAHLRALLQRARHEPVDRQLARLGEQAVRLAERLEKGPLEVTVEGNDLRLPAHALSEFWAACVHVIRNAVDHGLDDADARRRAGRDGPARLSLAARIAGDRFEVEIKDFGRGIDWPKLKARAEQRGLPCAGERDLVEALFADGVSTKDVATEVSGRGFGMGAARQACQQMGGSVQVTSALGAGTAIVFRLPLSAVDVLPPLRSARLDGGPTAGHAAAG
jgi:HAMP domain-containing protein